MLFSSNIRSFLRKGQLSKGARGRGTMQAGYLMVDMTTFFAPFGRGLRAPPFAAQHAK
jgi:hypothetical protein